MVTCLAVTNKYYAEGLERAGRVNDLFSSIARRYDLINDLQSLGLHRWWKRRLVNMARVRPGERALDLCCGTGDIAFRLARHGAVVTGLDFNEPMLEIARQRLSVEKPAHSGGEPPPIEFIRGDALQVPLPDSSFDLVTIGYGLRNLADVDAGLREMRRVLRPGGRVLVLDFGRPDYPIWRAIYFAYLRHICPLLGKILCGESDSYGYILESLLHYAAQRGVAAKMEQLQFTRVSIANLLGGVMSINYGEKPA